MSIMNLSSASHGPSVRPPRALLPLLLAAALGLGAVDGLAAADLTSDRHFDIPAQSLATALNALAVQGKVQIMSSGVDLVGRTASRLTGRYTLEQALDALLSGTELEYSVSGANTIVVRTKEAGSAALPGSVGATPGPTAAPQGQVGGDAQTLAAVNVFGTLDNAATVGSKSGLSLRETPKSVTIVTRERLDVQNLTSLDHAMKQTTGVTSASYGPVGGWYFSRGFRMQSIQIDGGAPAHTGGVGSFMTPDMVVYDHVEVLRGVDGMFTGAGEPGGIINLVRKRAEAYPQTQLNLSMGRWNARRFEFDVTGPLTRDGGMRGRLVAAVDDKDYYYDRGQSRKSILFGTASWDLTPTTLLTAGASHERRKEDGYMYQGIPRYSDGSDLRLPRSVGLNTDWTHWYLSTNELFATLEQKFGRSGTIKLNLTRLEQESDSTVMVVYGGVDRASGTGPMVLGSRHERGSEQNLLDLSVNGTFDWFGRDHRYTVGADYSRIDGANQRNFGLQGYRFANAYPVDVLNYDPASLPLTPAVLESYLPVDELAQQGYYATFGLQLADPLRLTLGGRYARFRSHRVTQRVPASGALPAPNVVRQSDSVFIPSVAVTWDFAPDWSAYASYAETFQVQANRLRAPVPGSPLDPVSGDGYEVGIKGEIFRMVNAAIALYRVDRNGEAVRDARFPNTPGESGATCCFVPMANITSEGIDLEFSGTILPGWQLFAGYTYNRSSYEGIDDDTYYSTGAYFLSMTPRQMFKAWTLWNLPGAASRWTLSAGVHAQTESYVDGFAQDGAGDWVDYRFSQGTYAIWNASVQYRISDAWTLGLYGDNLSDRTYYQVLGDVNTENVYGEPRSYTLTLRGRW